MLALRPLWLRLRPRTRGCRKTCTSTGECCDTRLSREPRDPSPYQTFLSLLAQAIRTTGKPAALVNLSEIDFEALQERFSQGKQRTEAEKLRCLIEGKLAQMLQLNHSRTDFAEKFQKLIDRYNTGSQNIESLFKELIQFARDLTEEERRAVAEGLSEEELALFDILTKPAPVLSKKEEDEVKAECRELLVTLKREKLVLDWREKQQAKAGVMQAIKTGLRKLPPPFTRDLQQEKFARTFAHIYDSYSGAGRSVYEVVAGTARL